MDDMHHEGLVIRPPAEADSILLQVTLGCSHNACTFCGAYKTKRFAIKPEATIMADIDFAARYCTRQRRVFLCDGDALVMPQERLCSLLEELRRRLPQVTRIGAYANAKSVRGKTLAELVALRERGLRILYMGLESGDDATLAAVRKDETAASIIAAGRTVRAAGIKLSVTVLLGLAGPEGSQRHARATGEAISAMQPEYASALSLMLIPGTPLHQDWEKGEFRLPAAPELLSELRTMLAATDLPQGQFFSNHASNYLPLALRLPRDKPTALERIDAALAGQVPLRPEWLRRL